MSVILKPDFDRLLEYILII